MLQGLNQGRRLGVIKAKVALVGGLKWAVIPIVNEQIYRCVRGDIAFGLRESRHSDDVLRRARIAGQQNADFAHGGAIAGGSAGPGVVAGELPVFVRGEAARSGVEHSPMMATQRRERISNPVSISMRRGLYAR